jgi:UDP-N-acetylmuramoyl-tripeptide--D-alanyl-D-alanine ligase
VIETRLAELPGTMLVHGSPDLMITHVTADSRTARAGSLFVCLPGRRYDGHQFLGEAARRGAVAALCARGRGRPVGGLAVLEADDPLAALGALGRLVRDRSRTLVVAVAGSAGKTSTKDILGAVLAPLMPTVASAASFNNELGVPLTLSRLDDDTRICICEIGTGAPGEIAALCRICRPDVAVITSIGPEHLQFFGSLEAVAAEEAEVIAALPRAAPLVLPHWERSLDAYRRTDLDVWRFGLGRDADVHPVRWSPTASFTEVVLSVRGERTTLRTHLRHPHHRLNLAAAAAVYAALGLPLDRLGEGAGRVELSPWRGEETSRRRGGLLINDAYNANPLSMRVALEALAARRKGTRAVAVLGEMSELGRDGRAWHARIGARAAELEIDLLIAVGPLARGYLEGAVGRMACCWLPDRRAAERALPDLLEDGDVVLLKGSRCSRLELLSGLVVQS